MQKGRVGFAFLVAGAHCASFAQADYASALWNPANSGNYSVSNRPTTYPIDYVVCHIMEGTYAGSISWFQNPASNVSAHYMVRSSDGQITQMVQEKNIAYHAGVWAYNTQSIGIEHEATISSTTWYTDNLDNSSARLTRYITTKYAIPLTRVYIIGHRETGSATSCPGPYWDFTKYMSLLQINATQAVSDVPLYLAPGASTDVIVRFNNTGVDTWQNFGNDTVWLDTSPAGRASPLFTSTGSGAWTSNSRVKPVYEATPGAGVGEFRFRVTAPTAQGLYSESFQLNRASVGRFGPIVKFDFVVGTMDKTIDNATTDFATTGTWSTATTATDKQGADYRFTTMARKTNATATWDANVPTEGMYDVYAWWPTVANRGTSVNFSVDDVQNGVISRNFNQSVGGGQWNFIGRARMAPGRDFVRMNANTRGTSTDSIAVADAIRVVGPR